MKTPKIAVILFPGSNCELEALRAVRRSNMEAELIRWNDHSKKLSAFDGFILPGGFSYEDRGRSGIIASKDPIMKAVQQEALNGKPVLGICNGAQILVETGMIPGLQNEDLEMALAWNERIKNGKILGVGFYNDWIYMRHDSKVGRSVYNQFSQKTIMQIPVAHGEGRFTTKDKTVLKNLIQNDQTVFRYCDANGKFIDEFPVNPNGAMYNLAAVCNTQGNVMALMPHPERTINGQPIFDSIASYFKSLNKIHVKKNKPLQNAVMRKITSVEAKNRKKAEGEIIEKTKAEPDIKILVRLNITDNEERTLENTLKEMGYKGITLYRQIHLGFFVKNKKDLKQTAINLIESGEILNLNKETATVIINNIANSYNKEKGLQKTINPAPKGYDVIAMEYDNYIGKNLHEKIKNHKELSSIQKVERGIHWTIQIQNKNEFKNAVNTHVFHNPHSMKLFIA